MNYVTDEDIFDRTSKARADGLPFGRRLFIRSMVTIFFFRNDHFFYFTRIKGIGIYK